MSNALFRTVVAVLLASASAVSGAQSIDEGFDDIAQLGIAGWVMKNYDYFAPWYQPPSGPFPAYNGAFNSYIAADYQSTSYPGIINNWLLMPNRILRNGDVITFYTRKGKARSLLEGPYADRLEVRLSTNGNSTYVGPLWKKAPVGDFTALLLSINTYLWGDGYPTWWKLYTVTISGLPAPTSGRVGFRYYVTDAGLFEPNGEYIGIDQVNYTPYVCPAFTMTPGGALTGGDFGQAYSTTLTQTGALGAPTFAVVAGSLPDGLSLSASGTISGTPSATGTSDFSVVVSDNSGCSGMGSYSIAVAATVPGAPQSVSAVAGDALVDVSWVDSPNNGGSPITGYVATCSDGVDSVSAPSVTMSPATVTGLTNGTAYTCTVTATNGIGTGPASAPSDSVTPKRQQTITFDTQADQVYSPAGTFAIDPLATATSSLEVTYDSTTPGVCTVSGTTVTIVAAGTCTITADQAGDANYSAAAQVAVDVAIVEPTEADLWVEKTTETTRARLGDVISYSILVGNAGPADAVGVQVLDLASERLSDVVWDCVEAVGTTCPAPASEAGDMDVTIDLPSGATVRFDLLGTVVAAADPEETYTTLENTANVALATSSELTDPDGSNDESTVGVEVIPEGVHADGFEPLPVE